MKSKILHIIANPKKKGSQSREIARKFLEEYKKLHPEDGVETLDLYDVEMPYVESTDMNALFVKQGKNLNKEEKERMKFKEKLITQFLSANKIIITSPMWNFGIPAILKSYIDHIVVAGRTFQYGPNGPEGLVKDKKICFIMSRGGNYENMQEIELQGKYLRTIFGFLGIKDQIEIVFEGTARTEGLEERKKKVIKEAKEKAANF